MSIQLSAGQLMEVRKLAKARGKKNHPKESKGKILGVHIKSGIVPVSNSSSNAKKGLACLISEENYPYTNCCSGPT